MIWVPARPHHGCLSTQVPGGGGTENKGYEHSLFVISGCANGLHWLCAAGVTADREFVKVQEKDLDEKFS